MVISFLKKRYADLKDHHHRDDENYSSSKDKNQSKYDPRSPSRSIRRTPIRSRRIVQTSPNLIDPRSPTLHVPRSPIPSGFPSRRSSLAIGDPRSPTPNIARTPLKQIMYPTIVDPRSPSVGITRTPIPMKKSATNNIENEALRLLDPRSPTIGVPRTPLPIRNTSSDLLPQTPNVYICNEVPSTPISEPIPLNLGIQDPISIIASMEPITLLNESPLSPPSTTTTNNSSSDSNQPTTQISSEISTPTFLHQHELQQEEEQQKSNSNNNNTITTTDEVQAEVHLLPVLLPFEYNNKQVQDENAEQDNNNNNNNDSLTSTPTKLSPPIFSNSNNNNNYEEEIDVKVFTPTKPVDLTPKRRSQMRLGQLKNRDIFVSSPVLSSYSPKRFGNNVGVLQDLNIKSVNGTPKRTSVNELVHQTSKLNLSSSPSVSSSPLCQSPNVSRRVTSTKLSGYACIDSGANSGNIVDENNPNTYNSGLSSLKSSGNNVINKPLTPKTPRVRNGLNSPQVNRKVELRALSMKFDGSPMKLNFDSSILM